MSDLDNIPEPLRERPQWVVWKLIERNGEKTKVPFAVDGSLAKSNDPATWTTFETAASTFQNGGGYAGIGYVFAPDDPFAGVDLDGCRDAQTGELADWASDQIAALDTYAEVSPSGTGVKLFAVGKSPLPTGKKKLLPDAPRMCDKAAAIELYDHGRFFCVTGDKLDGSPAEPQECQVQIDILAKIHFRESSTNGHALTVQPATGVCERARKYLAKIPPAVSGQGGHDQTFYAACVLCLGFNLATDEAFALLSEWNQACVPPWNERELRHKVESAMKQPGERGRLLVSDERFVMPARMDSGQVITVITSDSPGDEPPQPLSASSLVVQYPRLHEPIIEGLLRRRETMNIIAAPKVGKSWLGYGLALSVVAGTSWLDKFPCRRGRVLIIDNELHQPTLANRLRTVANAFGIELVECGDALTILSLRGRLANLNRISDMLAAYEAGSVDVVILDAFYRAMPAGASENDNATITGFYNIIDAAAERLGCSWVNIHHSSKGSQSEKTVVDVGAGAGSQSRAADAHLVLRQHEEEGAVVLEAVVRSFAPVEPLALRWTFPLWTADDSLDPAQLRGRLTRGEERQLDKDGEGKAEILEFLAEGAKTTRAIRGHLCCGQPRCDRLLAMLQRDKQIGAEEFTGNGGKQKRYFLIHKGGSEGGTAYQLLDHHRTT